MDWLQAADIALFRFVNQSLANPVCDWLMPRLSHHPLFIPLVMVLCALLLWKHGRRGRLCVLFLALVLILGDTFVCKTIKKAVGRPRPCAALTDTRKLIGCSSSGAMPSSHAANWFAAAMICFVYYRRSWRVMVPMATAVAISRVYNGVHYPADIVAGAILGAGYAGAGVWTADALWRWAGRKWFPLWWARWPSLMFPDAPAPAPSPNSKSETPSGLDASESEPDRHWLRLGYVLIAGLLLLRLGYLASGKTDLGKDEAYQWLWSKHLALSYYSKPPMIALAQWAGTRLWGDTDFGVRFASPVAAALVSLLLLRFFAREVSARVGVLLILATSVTPLLVLGSTLLTVDPLLVLFWTAALIAGWRAVQPDGATRHWLWAGLWSGLAFLSKYTALFLWLCWALFFVLWPPARAHLRRPGPWLAVLVNLLCATPVVVWNAQNGWPTLGHVAFNAALEKGWQLNPGHTVEFVLVTGALLHPIFFVGLVWAAVGFWKELRGRPLPLYLFCLGAPVYGLHLLYTLHSRILPNWIAPAVVPAFCLAAVFWDHRYRAGARAVKGWLVAGLLSGAVLAVFGLNPDLTRKLAGYTLPPRKDPLRRVQGWRLASAVAEAQRRKLAAEGKPAFIICDHYGMTGLMTFYNPEAKQAVGTRAPLVYPPQREVPKNQFFFWPEYRYRQTRRGHNAIYVAENDTPQPLPKEIAGAFGSVTELGMFPLEFGGRVTRTLQMWACRDLR